MQAAANIWLNQTENALRDQISQGDVPFLGLYSELFPENRRDYFKANVLSADQPIRSFIAELLGTVETLERVSVTAREVAEKDDRWEPFHVVHGRLREVLEDLSAVIDIEVRQFRKARQFHDRTVDVVVIDTVGRSSRFRYDLTGGIDHLMSKGRDTTVYRYVEET